MPTFKIYGASAETGEDTTFTVQANDPVEAEAIASHRRIMVSRVVEIEVSEPQISNLPAVVPQRVTEVQARVMPVVEAPYRYGPVCQACGGDMKKDGAYQRELLGPHGGVADRRCRSGDFDLDLLDGHRRSHRCGLDDRRPVRRWQTSEGLALQKLSGDHCSRVMCGVRIKRPRKVTSQCGVNCDPENHCRSK